MKEAGFNVTHLYGLTETYGPAAVNEWQQDWDALDAAAQAAKKARQGVRYTVLEALRSSIPKPWSPCPRDGETMGEVMFRGNMVMKGYLKNPEATEKRSRAAGFTPAISASCIRTAISSSRTAPRTSSSRAARTFHRSKSKTRSTSIPPCWRRPSSPRRTTKWGETPCAFVELQEGRERDGGRADWLVPRQFGAFQMPAPCGFWRTAEDVNGQD